MANELVNKFIRELEYECKKRDPSVEVTSKYRFMEHIWEIDIHVGQRIEGYVLFESAQNKWDWMRHYRL